MRRLRKLLALLGPTSVLLLATACAFIPRQVESPIPTRAYGDLETAEEVFVLLPGVFDSMEDFESSGFVPLALKASSGKRETVFITVDAHLGYYKGRVIHERLKDEVLQSLAGKKVTAVGVSLGGFGALVTARRYPELFDRIVLVAPFLGWPDFIEKIKENPNARPERELDLEFRALWAWLEAGADDIPMTLLYGKGDKFRAAYDHLETVAPDIVVQGREGGHDWSTWSSLWASWLKDDLAKNNRLAARPDL